MLYPYKYCKSINFQYPNTLKRQQIYFPITLKKKTKDIENFLIKRTLVYNIRSLTNITSSVTNTNYYSPYHICHRDPNISDSVELPQHAFSVEFLNLPHYFFYLPYLDSIAWTPSNFLRPI